MFNEKAVENITEAQRKEFLKKFEDGLNVDKTKSALHSIDMSLSIFGGHNKISLMDRPISRFVFHSLFGNKHVVDFFSRCADDDLYITGKEFEAFEKVCQGITTRIAQTAIEVIFRKGNALPHSNVDLWVIEIEWRELTGRVSWDTEVEAAVEKQMAGIFNHLYRLTKITTRTVDYVTIADELTDVASDAAHEAEAFLEASSSLLRQYLITKA